MRCAFFVLCFFGKAPEAVEPWNYTIRTTDYENICLQILKLPDEFVGSEDCLYLNVFTPSEFNNGQFIFSVCLIQICLKSKP